VNRLEVALRGIVTALERRSQRFALVGGLAVSARAEPRFTRDIDLALAVKDDDEAEWLVRDLGGSGYAVLATVEQTATHRLATVRLGTARETERGVVVDILFASSGIEPEVVNAATPVQIIPELTLPIASVGHLIALKVLSVNPERPQDAADLKALGAVAEQEDLDVALTSLDLIERRGFDRGRNLRECFREHLGSGKE
jgi:hypothetical protein